jgi:phosphoglycerate dehydrogenase-like enzyme
MSSLRLLILQSFAKADREFLHEKLSPFYEITQPDAFDEGSLRALIKEADVALGAELSVGLLDASRRLKLLQTPGSSFDHLDLRALNSKGVCVCNSSSHAPQVAEHAVAMLLSLMRKVALHDRLLRSGIWYRPSGSADDGQYQSDSLIGAKIGFIGYGRINKAISKLLTGFDVTTFVYSRSPTEVANTVELMDLFLICDAIFVGVPLTQETRGIISMRELTAKNPAPYLINISRAEIVNQDAASFVLSNKAIRGFAFDVPYGGSHDFMGVGQFIKFDNALISPHRAGTVRGQSPNLHDVVGNLVAFSKGEKLNNIIKF